MAEYIEQEKAYELASDFAGQASTKTEYSAYWKVARAIKELPAADVVEVVRCKDCAHAVEHKYSPVFFKCDGCSFLRGRLVSSNFYCKCGERRKGDG